MGPFWANRGKKDSTYLQKKLFVDEPFFICLRKDLQNEPFYNSRVKKPLYWNTLKYSIDDSDNDNGKTRRGIRDFDKDVDLDPAFFAARGKKELEK